MNYHAVPINEIPRLIKQPDGRLKSEILPTCIVSLFMEEITNNQIPFTAAKFKKISAA